jgi:hypothetical protein
MPIGSEPVRPGDEHETSVGQAPHDDRFDELGLRDPLDEQSQGAAKDQGDRPA